MNIITENTLMNTNFYSFTNTYMSFVFLHSVVAWVDLALEAKSLSGIANSLSLESGEIVGTSKAAKSSTEGVEALTASLMTTDAVDIEKVACVS